MQPISKRETKNNPAGILCYSTRNDPECDCPWRKQCVLPIEEHDVILEDWQLNSMDFSLGCSEVEIGLQDGSFEFFKIVKNENNQEVLISRYIDVNPRHKVILFWVRRFYPYIITRSSIDLTNIKFNAAQVLQIADDKGGRNLRLGLNNECDISLDLAPDSVRYHGWNVVYRGNGVTFEINIDPYSGDIFTK